MTKLYNYAIADALLHLRYLRIYDVFMLLLFWKFVNMKWSIALGAAKYQFSRAHWQNHSFDLQGEESDGCHFCRHNIDNKHNTELLNSERPKCIFYYQHMG